MHPSQRFFEVQVRKQMTQHLTEARRVSGRVISTPCVSPAFKSHIQLFFKNMSNSRSWKKLEKDKGGLSWSVH